MALPFKNGMELAQAMGFGKMYMASKQEKENEVQMESRKMNNKVIRLTEGDLHRIVKESVNRILREEFGLGHKEDLEDLSNTNDEKEYDFHNKCTRRAQETDGETAMSIHPQRNSKYGSNVVTRTKPQDREKITKKNKRDYGF